MKHELSRRILITGGSSGIGLEASKQLMQRGHQLLLLCRTEERCTETVKALSASETKQTTAKPKYIATKKRTKQAKDNTD